MKLHDLRLEVMATIGKSMDDLLDKYLVVLMVLIKMLIAYQEFKEIFGDDGKL